MKKRVYIENREQEKTMKSELIWIKESYEKLQEKEAMEQIIKIERKSEFWAMISAILAAVMASIGLFMGKIDSAAWGAAFVAAIGSVTYYIKARKDKKIAEIERGIVYRDKKDVK